MSATSLAERLRAATKTLHAQAERSGLMPALLRGQIGRHDYCRLLRNLHAIYSALEPALSRHAEHPAIAAIHCSALARTLALESDLRFLQGARWSDELALAAAAGEYAAHLNDLDQRQPAGLAAHAYVRYLGDLSGGQMLRRIVTGALNLEGEDGSRFYAFPEPGAAALAARFRAGLDRIAVDQDDLAELLVAEAQHGFRLHVALFEELAAGS